MTAKDQQFADHPANPYHTVPTHAEWFARAEAVAERHLRTASPEFCEWLHGRLDVELQAKMMHLVLNAPGLAAKPAAYPIQQLRQLYDALRGHREAWYRYVRSNPRELRTEIAREP